MKLKDFKKNQSATHEILKKMFDVVGADYDTDLIDDWYWKYEWTHQQELSFKNWLTEYLKSTKVMKEITGHKMVNQSMREKVASFFISNYGWKIKK